MKPSFCAIANRQSGEDLIGTAGHYQTYVLIECPLPWDAKVFSSKRIPLELRQYIKAIKAERSIQFLAINRGVSSSANSITLMVYENTVPSGMSSGAAPSVPKSITELATGYRGYEFQIDNLTQVVDCLDAHWQGDRLGKPITQKDILVCTHGMRDKCCAKFGQPFFREATQSAKQGKLPNTRVWRVSHIGGHRFAPTAISLPDGRYYGRLTLSALQSIITRCGSINQIRSVYRGWGLLPAPLQVLERQLLLHHGWSWLDYSLTYRTLSDKEPSEGQGRSLSVEITLNNTLNNEAIAYRATLVQDINNKICTKASCSSAVATPIVKYVVTECIAVTEVALAVKQSAQLRKCS